MELVDAPDSKSGSERSVGSIPTGGTTAHEIKLYEVFAHFLDVETWHTGHDFDLERFNQALAKVVRDSKFNADQMADYMLARKGVKADEDEHPFWYAINSRRDAAWAVREYLQANGLL